MNGQVGYCFSVSSDVEVEPIQMYGDADRHPRSSVFDSRVYTGQDNYQIKEEHKF